MANIHFKDFLTTLNEKRYNVLTIHKISLLKTKKN